MARVSLEEFKEKLAQGKPVPAVLLCGDQPFLRDACRAQLIEKFVPEAARAWAVSRFSAGRGETQAALDQAQSMPMLSKQQVVFLEDVQAIEDLGEKNRKATVDAMEEYLKNPAPFTVLVMEAAKLDMRMQLGKKLAEYSLVVEVAPHSRLHVYAPGAEKMGYRVISLKLDPHPQIHLLPIAYPASELYYFKPLKEHVPVFQKTFQLVQ
jgi:DNA polymerase III delta subunit